MRESTPPKDIFRFGIWFFAFGYFACYVPFSALTKALANGLIQNMGEPLDGFRILPASVMASAVCMLIFLGLSGWYEAANQWTMRVAGRKISIPHPSVYTLISGFLASLIIVTTVLAYTFEGVSIVFVMLLMRGGVLICAPLVDKLCRREVRYFSWVGFFLSLAATLLAYSEKGGSALTTLCAANVGVYILSYFVRLRFMSHLAKSDNAQAGKRFFVEEQLVAAPFLVLGLFAYALWVPGQIAGDLYWGFFSVWGHPSLLLVLLSGVLSQGVGVFGGLILLDKNENTFAVPVNRCSSILAGVFASWALYFLFNEPLPGQLQWISALLIVLAVLFLTIPPSLEKSRRAVNAKLCAP